MTGIFLPALALLLGRQVMKIDAAASAPEAQELRILTGVPIFGPLPGASLEHIAGRLIPLRIDPGTVVVRDGDAGDRFYVIVKGEVEVTAKGTPVSTLGPGGYFGEIALLKDVPRTATVTAKTPLVLDALDREDFLATVTGHAPSAKAAESVIGRAALRPRNRRQQADLDVACLAFLGRRWQSRRAFGAQDSTPGTAKRRTRRRLPPAASGRAKGGFAARKPAAQGRERLRG